ncbi:hypothetical protein IWQ55_006630 [Labrenzia sp. EL_208]|nr:hypothetical protein [Labrenzia sp. EL_132]MBG6233388.1 hypothetical protein [Labrenzia sp. EL_208]
MFKSPFGETELDRWYDKQIGEQVPEYIYNLNRNSTTLNIVELQDCWPSLEWYGIPDEWQFENGIDGILLETIRLRLAFEKAKIPLEVERRWVAQLRDTGRQFSLESGAVIIEMPNLRELNQQLLELHFEGVTRDIYQVVDYSEGCGAGGLFVNILSDPHLSNIYLIPDLYFSVCEDELTNPWDLVDCNWWVPTPGHGIVSGHYAFQGIDNNGAFRMGRVVVRDADIDSMTGEATITLRAF